MSKAEKFAAEVVKKRNLADNCWWLRLRPEKEVEYQAGQYVSMKVNEEGERRSYSTASWPGEKEIELLVDVTPMGPGSKYVLSLEEGDEVELLGPLGEFVVKREDMGEKTEGFLFVGTGSGVVPLRAMVHDLLEVKGEKRPVRLHWGMRYKKDLFWVEEFRSLEARFDNFKVDVVLSREGGWGGCEGHIQDCLKRHKDSWGRWQAYLCGNKEMIASVEGLLQEKGVREMAIHFEKFY